MSTLTPLGPLAKVTAHCLLLAIVMQWVIFNSFLTSNGFVELSVKPSPSQQRLGGQRCRPLYSPHVLEALIMLML